MEELAYLYTVKTAGKESLGALILTLRRAKRFLKKEFNVFSNKGTT